MCSEELAETKVTLHQASYAWTGTITHAMTCTRLGMWVVNKFLSLEVLLAVHVGWSTTEGCCLATAVAGGAT